MNRSTPLAVASLLLFLANITPGQVVGSMTADVTVVRVEQPVLGLSTRKQLLDRAVYNDSGQRIGKIDDLILDPAGSASLIIIGAGRFVGLKRHAIALPIELLTERDGVLTLIGATKQLVMGLPAFSYAKSVNRPPRKFRVPPPEASADLATAAVD